MTNLTKKTNLAGLSLTDEQQKLCDETADDIRRFETEATAAIAEIGAKLIKVKDILGHGYFGKWLKSEVNYTERTAQNYMNVARAFGDKSETVSQLPRRTTYDLASLPDNERNKIVDLIKDPKNPPVDTIKTKVENFKFEERQAKEKKAMEELEAAKDAKRSPAARRARKLKKEQEEAERKARNEKRERETQRLKKSIITLAQKLGRENVQDLVRILKCHDSYILQDELQRFIDDLNKSDQATKQAHETPSAGKNHDDIDELVLDRVD